MRARRDQVQAYKFVTRRIVAAMLSGEPETTDRPMRRLGFSVFASSMVAVLGMAGFGIWGVVTGQASDLEDNTLVIEKGSHARYAYVDGLLHPVSNIASAYLLFGTHEPEVRELPSDELVGIARGPELGIVGAPDGVPGADQLIDLPWSVCTVPPTVDSPDPQTTVVVGGELPGGTPLGEQGFYITANDQSYLLWNDRILPIAHDVVPVVLRLSAVRPTPVGTPFINATVAGPALTIVTPRSFLEPVGVDIGGEPAQAGFIYFTAGQHYMMTVDGLRPVGELTVALRTSLGAVVRDITGSAVRDHLDTSEPLEPAGYPQQVPELHPANGASPTICTVYRGPSDAGPATSIMVFESTPEPLAGTGSMVTLRQSTGDAAPASDRMLIPPGRGVLAQAASLDGTASPSATLYLITSDGYKYPLGAEGAREALGYGGGVEPVPVPETILAVIPTGPTLDVASAQTVAGSAPEPTTAGSAPES